MENRGFSRRWYQGLQVQVLVLFLVLGGILAFVARNVVLTHSQRQFTQYEDEILLRRSEILVKDLGQRVRAIETTARAMATFSATMPLETTDLAELIPVLLDADGTGIVTGGGIWPEPFAADPDRERASLFWGRDTNGKLEFFDDYNQPGVPPYFREEWYVPATYLDPDQAYWSRSYVDPYSHEPMTTCTVPYFRNGRLAGVVTVDVTLAGLNTYFAGQADYPGMYFFAVDHANRFLDYPQVALIRPEGVVKGRPPTRKFRTVAELAAIQPGFKAMADTLGARLATDLGLRKKQHPRDLARLAGQLHQRISGLTDNEAEIIAARILDPTIRTAGQDVVASFAVDPVLNEPGTAIIATVPRTWWRVVTVVPSSLVDVRVQSMVLHIARHAIGTLLVVVLLAAFSMRYFFLGRISRLLAILQDGTQDPVAALAQLHEQNPNEVGEVAFWFKHNTQDLQAAQRRAENAARAKSVFLANMSHEIRTPMNGILSAATLLQEPDDQVEVEKVMIIRRSAETLLAILNDILDFSKMEAGQFTIEERPFELVGTVESCRRLVENLALEKGLELRFTNLVADPCPVLGDGGRLRQVVLNLLTNAIKFTESGLIEIVLRHPADRPQRPGRQTYCIEVRDTGIGITREHIDSIFQVFEQVDSTLIRQAGGSGLGLAISKRLSRMMGGDLTVTSTPGKGSVFELCLELAAGPDNLVRTPAREIDRRPHEPGQPPGTRVTVGGRSA